MKVSDYIFSENEIFKLKEYRDKQSDHRLKLRFMALLPLHSVKDTEIVSSVIGKCSKTVKNRFRIYVSEGIGKLNTFDYKPKQSYLSISEIHQAVIFATWENPSTFKEVREYIEQKFGVSYDVETVRQLLKKYNVKIIRPGVVPGNPPTSEEQKKSLMILKV